VAAKKDRSMIKDIITGTIMGTGLGMVFVVALCLQEYIITCKEGKINIVSPKNQSKGVLVRCQRFGRYRKVFYHAGVTVKGNCYVVAFAKESEPQEGENHG